MKKALIITYQFPPFASLGVQRTINLVNHLPENGYEPVIFTLNEDEAENIGVKTDSSLYDQLIFTPNVYRARAYSIKSVVYRLMRLRVYRLFWFVFFSCVMGKCNLVGYLFLESVARILSVFIQMCWSIQITLSHILLENIIKLL